MYAVFYMGKYRTLVIPQYLIENILCSILYYYSFDKGEYHNSVGLEFTVIFYRLIH